MRVNVSRNITEVNDADDRSAKLTFPEMAHRHPLTVYAGKRSNSPERIKVPCWFVRHDGQMLLDGRSHDYKVPHLMYDRLPTGLKRKISL